MLRHLVFTVFFSLIAAPGFAQANDPIGRVLVSKGLVTAVETSATARNLRRGAPIFAGDRILTGPDGFTQLRLIDSAIISIAEDSEFIFREYHFFNNPDTPDSARLELKKGAFRTITGSIGDDENDIYQLITPAVDVIPQGTTYGCTIELDITYCGVTDGGIKVSNENGSVELGLGANYDYVQARSRQHSPEPLLQAPSVLRQNYNSAAFQFSQAVQASQSTPVSSGAGNMQATTSANNAVSPKQTSLFSNQPVPTSGNSRNNVSNFPEPEPIRISPYKKP